MGIYKTVSEFLIRRLDEHSLFLEVRGEIPVGRGNSIRSGYSQVAQGGSEAPGPVRCRSYQSWPSSVASWVQGLRSHLWGHNEVHRATVAGHLVRDSVGLADLATWGLRRACSGS